MRIETVRVSAVAAPNVGWSRAPPRENKVVDHVRSEEGSVVTASKEDEFATDGTYGSMESDGDGEKLICVRGPSAKEQAIKPSMKGEGAKWPSIYVRDRHRIVM